MANVESMASSVSRLGQKLYDFKCSQGLRLKQFKVDILKWLATLTALSIALPALNDCKVREASDSQGWPYLEHLTYDLIA